MKLKCPGCVKHIAAAVSMLIVLLLSLEAGLRLHGRHSPETVPTYESRSPLVVPSARCFHRLKPLMAVAVDNPDTKDKTPLRTNSLGLRGPEVAVPKPAGVYRVLVLGDESTLAPETPIEHTFCRHLQSLLQSQTRRKIEVVNAGVPDSCPLLAYLLLKHALVGLQPDLIVLCFDMSDIADDHRYRRFVRIDSQGAPLVCRNPAIDDAAHKQETKHRGCLLLDWAKRQLGRMSTSGTAHNDGDDISSPVGKYAWIKDRSPDWSVHVEQALGPIQRIAKLASRMSARFLVAAMPAPWQISAKASNTRAAREPAGIPLNAVYRSKVPFETLSRYLRKHDIIFCNPAPAFRSIRNPESLYWNKTPRLSPDGHKLYARELTDAILRGLPSNRPSRTPAYRTQDSRPRSAAHWNERPTFTR